MNVMNNSDDLFGSLDKAVDFNPEEAKKDAESQATQSKLDQSAATLKGFAKGFPQTWALTPSQEFLKQVSDAYNARYNKKAK